MCDREASGLIVHTSRGVVEVPETGDGRTDALLERICRRAGFPVTTAAGELRAAERRESRAESRAASGERGLVGPRHPLGHNDLGDSVPNVVTGAES